MRLKFRSWPQARALASVIALVLISLTVWCAPVSADPARPFPQPLSDYPAPQGRPIFEVLLERARLEPYNLAATLIFFCAIVHTFLAPRFIRLASQLELRHQEALVKSGKLEDARVSFSAEICHFLGEIEAIFGIWVIPLLVTLSLSQGWVVARDYIGKKLDFTEPLFVVVIMIIASSRPVTVFSEKCLSVVAALGGGSVAAWWFAILTVGPLLGSLITEPASMTICALLLAEKFYSRGPSPALAYATLGLLFVNVSIGGTLSHFAAPPVLMVATKWNWGLWQMLAQFGWKAAAAILLANSGYWLLFRKQFLELHSGSSTMITGNESELISPEPIPIWVTGVHLGFLAWTVLTSHFPALFIGGFLFYLAFLQATEHHQSDLTLRPALLVGFFLAGLVVHGGLQGWWIGPILSGFGRNSLFLGAGVLTAFNDNAAITYLASLVPGLEPELKYAVVAGAVAGGGLTVIANAPNPAGQTILSRFFPDGVSPVYLLLGALGPTILVSALFLLL